MLQLMQTKLCSIRFMPHYFIVAKVAVDALMSHSRVRVAETDGVVIFQPTKPQAYIIQLRHITQTWSKWPSFHVLTSRPII
jgi:hypothetical protein